MDSLIIDQNWLLVDEANIRKRGLGVKKKKHKIKGASPFRPPAGSTPIGIHRSFRMRVEEGPENGI
jgi:hypothetical protein